MKPGSYQLHSQNNYASGTTTPGMDNPQTVHHTKLMA